MILVLGIGVVVTAGLVAAYVQFLTFKRGVHYPVTVTVDGDTFTIQMHYRSKLPRWLKVRGFAMGGHAWMYWPLDQVSREDVAHEVLHLMREHVVGWFRYRLEATWEWVAQRVWRRRSTEEEARRAQRALAQTGGSAVEVMIAGQMRTVSAPFLATIARP